MDSILDFLGIAFKNIDTNSLVLIVSIALMFISKNILLFKKASLITLSIVTSALSLATLMYYCFSTYGKIDIMYTCIAIATAVIAFVSVTLDTTKFVHFSVIAIPIALVIGICIYLFGNFNVRNDVAASILATLTSYIALLYSAYRIGIPFPKPPSDNKQRQSISGLLYFIYALSSVVLIMLTIRY